MKNSKKSIILLSSFFLLFFFAFNMSTKIAYACELKEEKILKDAKGNDLETGKKYYISDVNFKKRGLTFEVWNNWNYVLASNERNDDKMHGTAVELYINGTNERKGLKIQDNSPVLIKMTEYDWAGYKYLNFDPTGGYVWLDKTGRAIYLESYESDDKVLFNTGHSITKYYDGFGRPTDKYYYKRSVTDNTYLQLFTSPQLFQDPNKLWMCVYIRMHSFWNGKDTRSIPTNYIFTPVETK